MKGTDYRSVDLRISLGHTTIPNFELSLSQPISNRLELWILRQEKPIHAKFVKSRSIPNGTKNHILIWFMEKVQAVNAIFALND